jgi:hypothetical protein
MGVCQDCLVTVDVVPNQRACMTKVAGPHALSRQEALAAPAVPSLEAGGRAGKSDMKASPCSISSPTRRSPASIMTAICAKAMTSSPAAAGSRVRVLRRRCMRDGEADRGHFGSVETGNVRARGWVKPIGCKSRKAPRSSLHVLDSLAQQADSVGDILLDEGRVADVLIDADARIDIVGHRKHVGGGREEGEGHVLQNDLDTR